MKNQLHVISTSSFILICVLFFLPFLNIECGNQKLIVVSGVELVTGFTMNLPSPNKTNESNKTTEPNTFAVLALLFSVVGALSSFVTRKQDNLKTMIITFAGLTTASLIAMQIQMNYKLSSDAKALMVRINFEFGYWLCLVIPMALIVITLIVRGPSNAPEEQTQ